MESGVATMATVRSNVLQNASLLFGTSHGEQVDESRTLSVGFGWRDPRR